MKILFETQNEKIKFSNWLKEVQGYATSIDHAISNPDSFLELKDDEWVVNEQERRNVMRDNSRKLWYRIYDVSESMLEALSPSL